MKRLYFVRHGLSDLGTKGLYAGQIETPLTEEGRAQVRRAGQAARKLELDLIVSSPYERALETAQIIATEIGYPPNKILTNRLLSERKFGVLEAAPYVHGPKNYAEFEGAETDQQLLGRAHKILKWLESLPANNILVAGHAGFGRALRSILQEEFPMNHPHRLQNAEIYQLL